MRRAGYMMIECMVYIGVLLVLLAVSYVALYRCIDRSVALKRNASDITTALHAGERWRADIRNVNGAARVDPATDTLRLPTPRGEILYRFESNAVLRRIGSNGWIHLLENVKSSSMQPDPRQIVTAWKWELELQHYKKDTSNTNRVRPLFTFVAVPGTPISQ